MLHIKDGSACWADFFMKRRCFHDIGVFFIKGSRGRIILAPGGSFIPLKKSPGRITYSKCRSQSAFFPGNSRRGGEVEGGDPTTGHRLTQVVLKKD